jgi:hypothetical protein
MLAYKMGQASGRDKRETGRMVRMVEQDIEGVA